MRRSLIRVAMIVTYPLLILLRALNRVLGRDPLRLREPRDASLWITRAGEPEGADYFSLDSRFEGAGQGSAGRLAAAWLLTLARWLALPRRPLDAPGRPDRDSSIPDEVYTLW